MGLGILIFQISGSSAVSPTKQNHISEEEYEDVAEKTGTKTFNSSVPTAKVPLTLQVIPNPTFFSFFLFQPKDSQTQCKT